MKWFFFFIVLSLNAFAVEVRNCPAKLDLQYSDFKTTRSFESLMKEFSDLGGPYEGELEALKTTWSNLTGLKTVAKTFLLKAASSGSCRYKLDPKPVSDEGSEEKVRIYTKSGKNILMVQTNIGPRGILLRVYAEMEKMNPERITLVTKKPGISLAVPRHPYTDYEAGGGLYFVGTVGAFNISSK